MKVKIKAVERDKCPYCGSANVDCDGRDADYSTDETWYAMYCCDCGKYWDEAYSFEFKGVYVNNSSLITPNDVGTEVDVDDED